MFTLENSMEVTIACGSKRRFDNGKKAIRFDIKKRISLVVVSLFGWELNRHVYPSLNGKHTAIVFADVENIWIHAERLFFPPHTEQQRDMHAWHHMLHMPYALVVAPAQAPHFLYNDLFRSYRKQKWAWVAFIGMWTHTETLKKISKFIVWNSLKHSSYTVDFRYNDILGKGLKMYCVFISEKIYVVKLLFGKWKKWLYNRNLV